MKIFISIILIFICGCHSANVTLFDNQKYEPTEKIDIYSDITTLAYEYYEIGYVEAKGGATVSKQQLLNDMIEKAKQNGANALIKIEFFDVGQYGAYIGYFEKPHSKAIMIRYK